MQCPRGPATVCGESWSNSVTVQGALRPMDGKIDQIAEDSAIETGLREKAKEFQEGGAELYVKA